MHFSGGALLAFVTVTATAYPYPESKPTQHLTTFILEREEAHNTESSSNVTLNARAEKGICTDLELPTEASYKTGYESFCKNWVPADTSIVMGPGSSPLVVTTMLRTHIGTTIPWVFKIRSRAWGYKPYYLKQNNCLSGFRDMLESDKAKLGTNFCVVNGTGGNSDSKKFWGQGYVLVAEQEMAWGKGDVNELSAFEARKRRGN
ncbi:hypothetical protein SVAN01_10175 [Stagonosporopsis vannaccii]|nr:hypothetical protein SVAN01_10175 [Stagonosporopsis vannaccii]